MTKTLHNNSYRMYIFIDYIMEHTSIHQTCLLATSPDPYHFHLSPMPTQEPVWSTNWPCHFKDNLHHARVMCRAQWLRGRASDSRLRWPAFESFAAVLEPWANFFSLHCSSSFSCINDHLTIDSDAYVYVCAFIVAYGWLDASQRSWDGVWLNRSARKVKCKALWAILRIWYCVI